MRRSPGRPDSKPSAQAAPFACARMIPCDSGEPTSSSATRMPCTGTRSRSPARFAATSPKSITAIPPFMSKAPGPTARPPSRLKPSNVPGAKTVSVWPRRKTGAPFAGPLLKSRCGPKRADGRSSTARPSVRSWPATRFATACTPALFSVKEFTATSRSRSASIAPRCPPSQLSASSMRPAMC